MSTIKTKTNYSTQALKQLSPENRALYLAAQQRRKKKNATKVNSPVDRLLDKIDEKEERARLHQQKEDTFLEVRKHFIK